MACSWAFCSIKDQVCCAGSRVFVHEDIYDRFMEDAVKAFDNIKVGMPWEEDTQMGVLQFMKRILMIFLNILIWQRRRGGDRLVAANAITEGEFAKGCFMRPTLIHNVTNDMRIAQEEIFGPVAVVISLKRKKKSVIWQMTGTYGLGGAVWTPRY